MKHFLRSTNFVINYGKVCWSDSNLFFVADKINTTGSQSSFASDVDDSTSLLARDSLQELVHLCPANTASNQTGISKDFCLPHLLKTRVSIKHCSELLLSYLLWLTISYDRFSQLFFSKLNAASHFVKFKSE